jgi:hypothetical protein
MGEQTKQPAETFLCSQCNKEFSTAEARDMHKKAKHTEDGEEPTLTHEQKRKIKNWSIGIGVLALLLVAGFYLFGTRAEGGEDAEGLESTADIPSGPIHWHPELTIIIDGQKITIPPGIGLTGGHKPIHTHESDGTLHVENNYPTKKNMRLGYFFEIWDKEFSNECIFTSCTDAGTLRMTVDGVENLEFDDYILQDGDKIVIEYVSNTENIANTENISNDESTESEQ